MASSSYVLIVEDEFSIRELIRFACAGADFEVKTCENVSQAQALIGQSLPSLVLLDNLLPGKTGVEWLRELRANETTRNLPVIMITALGSESERVLGLESGADDYIVKPFMPRELIARIRALLRRYQSAAIELNQSSTIQCGPFEINEIRHEVSVNGEVLSLSAKEYDLVRLFVKNPGRVFTREILLSLVWTQAFVDERTVDVHILRVRKHLKEAGADNFLQTVRGIGYKLDLEVK